MATISNDLVAEVMRHKMECKDALKTKGSFYVGTGGKETIQSKDIPETTGFEPGENNNGVLIRDTSDTNTTGWKVAKITADNLEGGRVENADNVLVSDGVYQPLVKALLSLIYPIGSIYMSANNVSPETFLGGTWVRWGQGLVPVGLKDDDDDFKTSEQTGGEKAHVLTINEMPKHDHVANTNAFGLYIGRLDSTSPNTDPGSLYLAGGKAVDAGDSSYIYTTFPGQVYSAGGGQAHNNLQPYITCYMWKRTA